MLGKTIVNKKYLTINILITLFTKPKTSVLSLQNNIFLGKLYPVNSMYVLFKDKSVSEEVFESNFYQNSIGAIFSFDANFACSIKQKVKKDGKRSLLN